MLKISRRAALVLAAAGAVPHLAFAQSAWPNRLIRLISPYGPGGDSDSSARIVARHLASALGVQVVVENKAGAATLLGSDIVAKSPADGYTLLWAAATHTSNPSLYDKLPFDTVKDFVPIINTTSIPFLVVVSASSPVKTLKEYIDTARSDPSKASMASAGNGSRAHFAIETLADVAGFKALHVPYKGSAQALGDIITGRVSAGMHGLGVTSAMLKANKLRALAVIGPKRFDALPDVATMRELGYPAVDTVAWFGLLAPAGTPPAIVNRLNTEVNRILANPEVIAQFALLGCFPTGGSAEEFRGFIASDMKKMADTVRERNIKLTE
jgi:tripartite-type tricarboxylate transporter receptor subunit TctC